MPLFPKGTDFPSRFSEIFSHLRRAPVILKPGHSSSIARQLITSAKITVCVHTTHDSLTMTEIFDCIAAVRVHRKTASCFPRPELD
jgi:hypothetical protein